MKRSRAFVLTEILTGMALQAGFLLVMCTAFYMMLSFYTRTQQVLTARDRGQRVIAYFDQRIRNAGLGLWKCETSQDVRDQLGDLIDKSDLQLKNLVLPVALTTLSRDNKFEHAFTRVISNSIGHNAYSGNILTMTYAERNIASSSNLNLVFVNDSNDYQVIELGKNETSGKFKLLDNETKIAQAKFDEALKSKDKTYIVTRAAGVPLLLSDMKKNTKIEFNLSVTGKNIKSVNIYPMDELLYLKCVRLFVEGTGEDSNFKYQYLRQKWTDKIPHEKGVLEIYMELDTETKIFDLYVLTTGGKDSRATRSKPELWPSLADWKDDYLNYSLYVSHASWKLHNMENMNINSNRAGAFTVD